MLEKDIIELLKKNNGAMYRTSLLKELAKTENASEEQIFNQKIYSLVRKQKIDYKTVFNTEVIFLTERHLH